VGVELPGARRSRDERTSTGSRQLPRATLCQAVEQFCGRNVEPSRHAHDGGQAEVALAALQPSDLGGVEVTRIREFLLRPVASNPKRPDVLSDALLGLRVRNTGSALASGHLASLTL